MAGQLWLAADQYQFSHRVTRSHVGRAGLVAQLRTTDPPETRAENEIGTGTETGIVIVKGTRTEAETGIGTETGTESVTVMMTEIVKGIENQTEAQNGGGAK